MSGRGPIGAPARISNLAVLAGHALMIYLGHDGSVEAPYPPAELDESQIAQLDQLIAAAMPRESMVLDHAGLRSGNHRDEQAWRLGRADGETVARLFGR